MYNVSDQVSAVFSCTLGYVAANLQGQVEGSSGEKFCGGLLPPPLISTEPRMVMLFNTSNGVLGRGFKANYRFITGQLSFSFKCV